MQKDVSCNIVDVADKIRNIVDSNSTVPTKLSKIVETIAQGFCADASALYISMDDLFLDLFAGYGFNQNAMHKVSLRFGEGIVGDVAKQVRTISLADAWEYPNFSYKSEIGEDKMRSFLGVPIIRWRKAIGVLTLQKFEEYEFSQEDVKGLETIAMIISNLISSEEVQRHKTLVGTENNFASKEKVVGSSLSKGCGIGNAVVHHRVNHVTKIFTDDKENELARFNEAHAAMNTDLDERFNNSQLGSGEYSEILDTYVMFAKDKGWYKKISGNIQSGMTAEAAIEAAYDDMWNRLSNSSDTYLKERLLDLRDVADRLHSYLRGETSAADKILSNDIVVVAKSMGPADLMDYDYKKIRGLVIEEGTATMHVTIVAKAMGIPVVSKTKNVFDEVRDGQKIAVDGDEGCIYINPSASIISRMQSKIDAKREQEAKLAKIKDLPVKTLDDVSLNLYINIGLSYDLDYIEATNCDGIGLYRTEIPFMAASKMPDVATQTAIYKELMDKAGDKRVVFRSLDVGSDKLLPYWYGLVEENPAIGWRSIRITLDRRAILRQQMRAFLRATAGKELNVMFPMIANYEEFMDAKETLMIELDKLVKAKEEVPKKINVGLMMEVPSVVFQLDEILKEANFISIGTNDLAQFVFACDRGNSRLTDRYDVLSSPFLRVLKKVIDKSEKAGVHCSVCGEMASNAIEALALIGIGYRNLSVSGANFGKIKSMIRTVEVSEIEDYMNQILAFSKEKTIRPQLKSFAYDHAIEIY